MRPFLPSCLFVIQVAVRAILEEITTKDLVTYTAKIGKYLFEKLEQLASRYPGEIMNLRGKDRGTFIAFDSPRRDELLKRAKSLGVNLGGCGEKAIRLRPMLVFQKHHGKTPFHVFDVGFMLTDDV